MKWILPILAGMMAVSCGQKAKAPKILVLYYSQTATTKAVAEELQTRLGADIEAIVPVEPYEGNFQETIERCMKEREQEVLPEVNPLQSDIAGYDVIFLGYPIWFGTYAPPVASLLGKVDLSGKKVVPFCTFGSGGLTSSVRDLAQKQPNAEILPGYGVRAARIGSMPAELDRFLKEGGFVEGEVAPVAEFPEQHPVSEEESAIFDAAVDGYPMLHAKATTVASRALPEGVEYLFTAVDLPREDAPQAVPGGKAPKAPKDAPKGDFPKPAPREMQVYVTVPQGGTPEFTQVVR